MNVSSHVKHIVRSFVGAMSEWCDQHRELSTSSVVLKMEDMSDSMFKPDVVQSTIIEDDGIFLLEVWPEDGVWKWLVAGPEDYDAEGMSGSESLSLLLAHKARYNMACSVAWVRRRLIEDITILEKEYVAVQEIARLRRRLEDIPDVNVDKYFRGKK